MSIGHLLNQEITLEPSSSRDAYEAKAYGASVAVACRIEGVSETLRMPDDQEQVITREIFVEGDTVVDEQARLTLPDGTQPPIVSIMDMPGRDGTTHHRVIKTGVKRS